MAAENTSIILQEIQERLEKQAETDGDDVIYLEPQDFYFTSTSEMSEVRMIDEFDYVLGAKNGDGSGAINISLQSLVNRDKYLEDKIDEVANDITTATQLVTDANSYTDTKTSETLTSANSYTDTEVTTVNNRIDSEVIALSSRIAELEKIISDIVTSEVTE